MKKLSIALVAATGLFTLSACNNNESETIVETKAGDITKDEFYQALKDRFGKDVLTELVHEKVLSEKYKVSDKEIQAEFDKYQAQLGTQFTSMVEMQGEDVIKDILKVDLLRKKAAEAEVKVTDEEVKEYYDSLKGKIKASHILVADEKTAKEIADKLKSGEKFEDLAKQYSTDPGSAQNGGDLGWFAKGSMVKEFEDTAFKLKEGEVSAPVKSDYGYHIIKVTKTVTTFEKMKDYLKEDVSTQKLQQPDTIQSALDKELENANVKVKDEDLKNIFDKEETETNEKTTDTQSEK
ncbi:peptidylprolyl isomerase [Metabacillus niabensis]|uniref:Foldase protein PrsA n=1 Tax=Metabacillus niabensis TaxID=324854 RepID=A0ABT9YY53_9BACI|nr:peptidylprolyl isomerase [Metabacillus niabensis]MDQ0224268.1 foldase protein PrsA [Metabacillus niabensis]